MVFTASSVSGTVWCPPSSSWLSLLTQVLTGSGLVTPKGLGWVGIQWTHCMGTFCVNVTTHVMYSMKAGCRLLIIHDQLDSALNFGVLVVVVDGPYLMGFSLDTRMRTVSSVWGVGGMKRWVSFAGTLTHCHSFVAVAIKCTKSYWFLLFFCQYM